MICSNCNNQFHEKFCGFCGQSVSMNHKIKAKDLATDIFHSIFHTGGGLLFTLKMLFIKPEIVLEGYLSGKRKIFFSPIKLFLIFGVLYIAINHYVNENNSDRLTKSLDYYISHYKYLVMFLPVIFSTIINWAIYNRKKLSFTEHFVIIMYIQSIVYSISCCVMLINKIADIHIVMFGIFFEMMFYIYATTRFYCKKNILKGIILNLFIYIVVTLSFMLPLFYLASNS